MDILRELTGDAAAVVGTLLMLPQVLRSWRSKRVDDIAYGMVLLYVANCALWLAYGLMIAARPVVITNAAAFVISLVQLGLKVRYGARRSAPDREASL